MSAIDNIQKNIEEFVEKGADLEHSRWSKWQKYMHGFCIEQTITPPETANMSYQAMTFPKRLFDRWQKQINTKYKNLTEKEKDSDREQVKDYIPLFKQSHISFIESEIERLRGEKFKLNDKMSKTILGDEVSSIIEARDVGIVIGHQKALQKQIDNHKKTLALIKEI